MLGLINEEFFEQSDEVLDQEIICFFFFDGQDAVGIDLLRQFDQGQFFLAVEGASFDDGTGDSNIIVINDGIKERAVVADADLVFGCGALKDQLMHWCSGKAVFIHGVRDPGPFLRGFFGQDFVFGIGRIFAGHDDNGVHE